MENKDFLNWSNQNGLLAVDLTKITGTLSFETPIRINSSVVVGNNVIGFATYTGPSCFLKNVQIGRFCAIGERVQIGPPNHPTNWISVHPFQYNGVRYFDDFENYPSGKQRYRENAKKTIIGNDVWIGNNAVIIQGVTVGTGAVIGANAVVTKDVPPYAVVGGVPAKIIRHRFPEEKITQLLASEWWNYNLSGIEERLNFDDVSKFIVALKNVAPPPLNPKKFSISKTGNKWQVAIDNN